MKKLMMAVAIVCAAVGVKAAVVDWSFEADDAMGTYVVADTATYYMIVGDAGIGATLAEVLSNDGVDAFTAALDGYKYNTGSLDAGAASGRVSGFSTESNAAIFIFNDGVVASSSFAYTEYDATDSIYTPPASASGLETYASDFGDGLYAAAWGTGSVAGGEVIPEPSSALLLLLGMAGIALRRKQA